MADARSFLPVCPVEPAADVFGRDREGEQGGEAEEEDRHKTDRLHLFPDRSEHEEDTHDGNPRQEGDEAPPLDGAGASLAEPRRDHLYQEEDRLGDAEENEGRDREEDDRSHPVEIVFDLRKSLDRFLCEHQGVHRCNPAF